MKKNEKDVKKNEKDAIADVFGNATVTKAPEKPKKSKDREEVEMGESFDTFVFATVASNALKGVVEQLGEQFKTSAFETFREKILATGIQPETFNGIRGEAQAAFEYRKRSAGLPAEMAERFDKLGIPYDSTDEVPERFVINPEVLGNQELLGKLAMALKEVKDFAGIDIIQKQEASRKYQINDATIKAVVEKVKDKDEQSEILRSISTIAVARPKINGEDAKDESAVSKALRHLADVGILNFGKKTK